MVRRMWMFQLWGFAPLSNWMITGKPSPPAMMARQMGVMIHGSAATPMRLSLNSENPALLNAEMAWNVPCQRAVAGFWS